MKTSREKLLLLLLLAVVFGGINFYGYEWLVQKQQSLDLRYAQYRADKAEALLDLRDLKLWAARKDWIEKHEPVLTDEGDAKAQVLESVLKGARDQNLEVLEQSLGDAKQGAGGIRINVSIKVRGPMQGLCQWLTGLQKPDSFYAVCKLSLKADQDAKSMVCTLELARFFHQGT